LVFQSPALLTLDWGEIAERRMHALCPIDLVDELPDLRQRLGTVVVLCQGDLLFLDEPDPALGIAVLPWVADRRHADLDPRACKVWIDWGAAY
jgi:hypothetical protein